jgi:vacuolar-type H+-ATPase subunit I/STV1
MKRAFLVTLVLASLLLTTACAPAATPSVSKGIAPAEAAPPVAGFAAPGTGGGAADAAPGQQPAAPKTGNTTASTAQTERLVIKNATLSIVVDDATVTVNNITKMAEEMGGFVVSLNTSQTLASSNRKVQSAKMVVRVPAEKLNEALAQIKKTSVEVVSENIAGQDVTSEYTDLKSQLTNLERAEKQMQTFLDQTKNTDETLKVYNQLVSIRQQIETVKGRMKYYEQSAALSAITLTITPNALNIPIQVAGWRPEGTVKESVEMLVKILQNLADFLIRFGIVCMPFIIVLGVPSFFFGRWAWKKWMVKK